MPELPEVEWFRGIIEDNCLRKRIAKAEVKVPYLLKDTTSSGFEKRFTGARLLETRRHGKYLFARADNDLWIYLHFGLTGDLVFLPLKDEPRFTAFSFQYGKNALYFTDMRKFGRFGIIEDPDEFLKEKRWGPDALDISEKEFVDGLKRRKAPVKNVLMDQKFIAGIGNEYSDEILFRTRVHPETPAAELSLAKLKGLYLETKKVLKQAIKLEAERSLMKKKLFFVANRKTGLACPRCGGRTVSRTVGGRTAYFCPACQKK